MSRQIALVAIFRYLCIGYTSINKLSSTRGRRMWVHRLDVEHMCAGWESGRQVASRKPREGGFTRDHFARNEIARNELRPYARCLDPECQRLPPARRKTRSPNEQRLKLQTSLTYPPHIHRRLTVVATRGLFIHARSYRKTAN